MGHRTPIVQLWPLNAKGLRLAVDAFAGSPLVLDGLIEGTLSIQQRPHQPTFLPIGILDTALAFGKLRMVRGLPCRLRKEERAAKALRATAMGVRKLVGGMHAQASRAVWRAIGVARHFLVPMAIEQNGGDALKVARWSHRRTNSRRPHRP
jgi:hypothetical protein